MQTLICEHCSNVFYPARINRNNPRRFCSPECSHRDRDTRVPKPCKHCSAETLNPNFCSRSCSASYNNHAVPKRKVKPKTYKEPKPFLSEDERYRRKRAIYNEAWARYMTKRKYQTPVNEDIKALQDFYTRCPDGYEVDHIIPISKGGLHSLTNLQYLTKSENRRKSNKIVAPVVGIEPTQ